VGDFLIGVCKSASIAKKSWMQKPGFARTVARLIRLAGRYTFPSIIIAFLICCVISFFYLQRYAGTPSWLSAILAVPVVLLLFAALIKLGRFCG
jgi:hypothetical protein